MNKTMNKAETAFVKNVVDSTPLFKSYVDSLVNERVREQLGLIRATVNADLETFGVLTKRTNKKAAKRTKNKRKPGVLSAAILANVTSTPSSSKEISDRVRKTDQSIDPLTVMQMLSQFFRAGKVARKGKRGTYMYSAKPPAKK